MLMMNLLLHTLIYHTHTNTPTIITATPPKEKRKKKEPTTLKKKEESVHELNMNTGIEKVQ